MRNLQSKASHPKYSIWVSASAGTGKTKILTDRVLRLLLEGEAPEKILCLTYTNAAASEMQHRIGYRLESWANQDNTVLKLDLNKLLGRLPTQQEIVRAKNLYNKSLGFDNKIELHTIHSYCQKILKRFPLESKVSPGFQILDDMKATEVLTRIKNQIYLDQDHNETILFFMANFHENVLENILEQIINQKLKFKNLFNNSSVLDTNLEIDSNVDALKNIKLMFYELVNSSLEIKQKLEQKVGSLDKLDVESRFRQQIFGIFFNKDGSKSKQPIPKILLKDNPLLLELSLKLQEEIYQFDQKEKIIAMLKYSRKIQNLAELFIHKYESYKEQQGLLDYDDLIYFTKSLLNSNTRDWVLYKLDGGIDHLLIDEAQDTSPEQWEIIEQIIAEFYVGQGAKKAERTIFVVGDEKQSIFSFQGADLDSLNRMRDKLKKKLTAVKKEYYNIDLIYSFRSVPSVLEVVHNIFEDIKKQTPDFFIPKNPKILPFRSTHYGKVQLWPIIKSATASQVFWSHNLETSKNLSAQRQLAIKIAEFIKTEIHKGYILPSTGLPVRSEDFMILVRKRDELAVSILDELKKQSIPTTGIDRMILNQNISVLDLISVAKFVLAPQDNLNLATLLKSPIIGLKDKHLKEIIDYKTSPDIWTSLQAYNQQSICNLAVRKLKYFIKLYNETDLLKFFQHIVDVLDFRQVLIEANGTDSNDAIDELLYLSFDYANNTSSSLQHFICWFENNEKEVKRNVEASDKIKLMTVHGAKGLQAPIVILCDNMLTPINQDKFLWTETGGILSCRKSSDAPDIFKQLKEKYQHQALQEYMRLLYVGMTRAEDQLIFCSYQNEKSSQHCWYNLVENTMKRIGTVDELGNLIYESNDQTIFETTTNTKIFSANDNLGYLQKTIDPLTFEPHHIKQYSAQLDTTTETITQTRNADFKVTSPLRINDSLKYGRILHKILEDVLKTKNLNNLSTHPLINTLLPAQQIKLHSCIDNLMLNHEFIDLVSKEIKLEVNIGLVENGNTKLGRIDFLSVGSENLTIIDYKSDLQPPLAQDLVPFSYIEQLNFYARAVKDIYPNHKIFCKILWLENGELMNI